MVNIKFSAVERYSECTFWPHNNKNSKNSQKIQSLTALTALIKYRVGTILYERPPSYHAPKSITFRIPKTHLNKKAQSKSKILSILGYFQKNKKWKNAPTAPFFAMHFEAKPLNLRTPFLLKNTYLKGFFKIMNIAQNRDFRAGR